MVFGLSTAQQAGLVMLSGSLGTGPIIWYVWDLRDGPGVIWFIMAMVAGGAWSLIVGLNPFITNADVTITLHNLRYFVVSLAVICWLLLAVEYTFKRHVSTRVFGVLVLWPILTQLLLWTNHMHGLVYTVEQPVNPSALVIIAPEPWWYIDGGFNYLLVLMAAGMWFGEFLTSEGERHRQTALFLLSTAILIATGILYSSRALYPLDPTPISFVIAGVFIAYALLHYQLFQVAPVAHETAIQQMDDAVVILNSDDEVTETNPPARRLFGAENATGAPMTEFFSEYPNLIAELEGAYDLQTEITIPMEGGEWFFDLNVTSIARGRGMRGRVVVLRDITSLKQREEALDLAKQVLTRVFRHNVRNDLTAIRGYAEAIEAQADDEIADHAADIVAKGEDLVAQSEKARFIEDVLDADATTVAVSLAPTVERAIDSYREDHPDVVFEVSVPDDITIAAHPNIQTAIEQVIENAIEHHDEDPTIGISVEESDDDVILSLEDDGRGIPDHEIETILDEEETALKHGSGIGLWLVHWILDHSGGELLLENTDDGARVGLRLQQTSERVQVID